MQSTKEDRLRENWRRCVRVALAHGITTNSPMVRGLIDKYLFAPEELTPLECPLCHKAPDVETQEALHLFGGAIVP